mmetsp:Transcript_41212/g.118535  ORF Transcript_41212/g.118535 Transcript_41212/m.118535 type:complete len:206 (+) Transcript_41212:333-950(+)
MMDLALSKNVSIVCLWCRIVSAAPAPAAAIRSSIDSTPPCACAEARRPCSASASPASPGRGVCPRQSAMTVLQRAREDLPVRPRDAMAGETGELGSALSASIASAEEARSGGAGWSAPGSARRRLWCFAGSSSLTREWPRTRAGATPRRCRFRRSSNHPCTSSFGSKSATLNSTKPITSFLVRESWSITRMRTIVSGENTSTTMW